MSKRPDDIPIHPHKWLLAELPHYLDAIDYDQLMDSHAIVKRRYDLSSKLRATQTELQRYQKALPNATSDHWRRSYAAKIERRKARIQAIEKELREL